ncbi:MAG: hypothetical protein H5T83_03190, partial [Actinotalea sp.]|nr:hypothetical protein [Actinotalea sp.]
MTIDDERGVDRSARSRRSLLLVAVVLAGLGVVVAWALGRGPVAAGPGVIGTPTGPTAVGGTPTGPTPSDAPGSATPSARPSSAAPSPTGTAPTEPPAVAPLPDLFERFSGDGDIRSDLPAGEVLQDGSFFAILHDADPAARTVTADIAVFLTGEAALEHLRAEDPERAADGLENGYLVVNDVERLRVLPVAPTARVGTWCFDEAIVIRERAFAEWASADALAPTTACSEPARQANDPYWLDVRGGEVAQMT